MNASDFERAREIFLRARLLPVQERDAYLREACAGDTQLFDEVTSLLKADGGDSSPTLDAEHEPSLGLGPIAGELTEEMPAPLQAASTAPQQIGPYRLLEPIGEGGMGTV